MRFIRPLLHALPVLGALVLAQARDASACGGCFHETQMTQVVGHRMILSVSKAESTLWDQIQYTGDPLSFAWVLPIKGPVTVGVSADALFQTLQQITQVTVEAPPVFCNDGTSSAGNGGGPGGGGVIIIDQSVVGPYDTVQLAANDPMALVDWLTTNGYNIPPDIQPIIDDYVGEGFGFLAIKLKPGAGIDSMKPVRVTTPGAAPVLPLRMVAAGTGPSTAVQLWVVSEGRYEPQNFPWFVIKESELLWDWDINKSNYATLVDQKIAQSNGYAWLVDYAQNISYLDDFNGGKGPDYIANVLQFQALMDYADQNGMNAQQGLDADMLALYGSLNPPDVWVSHFFSKLSRPALGTDMQVQAAVDQSPVVNSLQVTASVGVDPCGNTGGGGAGGSNTGGGNAGGGNAGGSNAGGGGGSNAGGSGGSSAGGSGGSNGDDVVTGGNCNCSVAGGGRSTELGLIGLALGAAFAGMRRRRRAR